MARTISDEELQLKRRARRRLIGAIVLVTAIVVVLPMVLDSEPKPVGREISVRIPSPDAGPFAGQIAPLPAQKDGKTAAKAPESAPAAEGKASVAAAAPQESAPAAEAKPVQAAPRKEAAKPKPKPKPKPAKAAEGQFVVQVIALADADKARQMQERIAAAGIKSYTEIVKTAKGDVTRVRAGPFATRDAAEKAREQLKTLGMSGNITGR
ncbi:MAG TPA: SPOR domain-containing protein [Burkholderiales bacterium]|nr:SPOR domain-containing protein [Burkholderiales bacterium]